MVLQAAVSLRGAAAIFFHLRRLSYDPQGDWPSAGTIQMWLLRLGLDELQKPLEKADDWVWLVDHTVQIGKTKCLLIVGIRLSKWRELGGKLTHHELAIIALSPVEHSDGETVYRQLEEVTEQFGLPREIVSDLGGDLRKGIELFLKKHPEVAWAYDIAHKVALLLKKILEADSRWTEFTRQCGFAKSRLQQTSLAQLIPPSPKLKARYMNADRQVEWGLRVLQLLKRHKAASPGAVDTSTPKTNEPAASTEADVDPLEAKTLADLILDEANIEEEVLSDLINGKVITRDFDPADSTSEEATSEEGTSETVAPPKVAAAKVSQSDLEDKLGWVREFAEPLASWSRLMSIAGASREFVRHKGYHADAADQLRKELTPHGGDALGDQLIEQVCRFVAGESASARPGERLIGSTEILESLIGKGKRLEGQQSKSGFTKMILSLAAVTVAPTIERVREALTRTPTKQVTSWTAKNLPISLQAQRRAALQPVVTGTKPG
jgi:hypothetical protein